MTVNEFFENLQGGARWDVGVSINRSNSLPLDANSVFASKEALDLYAAGTPEEGTLDNAYPSQIAAVVTDTETTFYYIDQNMNVQPLVDMPDVDNVTIKIVDGKLTASIPEILGDNLGIDVDNNTVSLHDFGKVFYKYVAETGSEETGDYVAPHYDKTEVSDENPWKAGLEPRVVSEDGKLVIGWYEPNPTTIEGVNNQVTAVEGSVKDLETSVGTPSGEGQEATGLYKEVEDVNDNVTDLQESIYGEGGTSESPAEGSIAYDVNELDKLVGLTDATTGLVADMDAAEQDIADIKEEIGTQATEGAEATGIYKVIENAAAKAVEDATYDDTAVKADIQANADAIADLREDLDAIEIPDVPVTNVSGDGKIIDVTPTDGDYKVSATLSLNYDSDTTKLQLLGINNEVVDEIDATAFIKDGMLDKVELDTETEEGKAYLVLTWNTDAGKTETSLDVTELIDVYTAGHGIKIENAEINLKLGTGSETAKYLTATEDGLNISGVDKAISDAVTAHNNDKSHLTSDDVDGQIDAKLTAADYDKKIADAQAAATEAATDADFITSVEANDNLVVTDKKLHLKTGYQLLADTDKEKLDKLTLTGDDLTISGSVEAGSVKNLDQWIEDNRAKVDGLYPAADAEKLAGVEAGAEVNVIEEVQVNGVKVTPDANKAVNIEVPDAVVTSDKENQVTIEEDKTMTVNSLNVNKLVQTSGDTLILYGGSASDLINTNGAE